MSESAKPQPSRDAPGPDDVAAVTRSEEELRINTVRRETQRARLTKFVEAETETRTFEVRHDQVRIEYEPISALDDADRTAPTSVDGSVAWMVLDDEEVVLTTRRIPRERARLRIRSVTEDREIAEMLRREQVEVIDGSSPAGRRTGPHARPTPRGR